NPRAFRQEFLKSVVFFLMLMPLVDAGLVHLVPDPGDFDRHLRDQVFQMAQSRWRGVEVDPDKDPRMKELMREDAQRSLLALPPDALRRQVRPTDLNLDDPEITKFTRGVEYLKRADPLAVLQDGTFDGGTGGGLMSMSKLAPNFEMAMYLAQAIGGSIVTDSLIRWEEIQRTIRWRPPRPALTLQQLSRTMKSAEFAFVRAPTDILDVSDAGTCSGYATVMKEAFRYASHIEKKGEKANFEAGIAARFSRTHAAAQKAITKTGVEVARGLVSCAFPWGGFQDNTINRLLLMSSSEHHLPSVPAVFYISRP
ncbi:MAG: hypothetical protein SF339_19615, partial [Blastocatellia bacterium]|nr:hypothetical protein [Blastocatellia bacterium]